MQLSQLGGGHTDQILPHEGFDSSSAWLADAGHGSSPYLNWPYLENSGTGLMMKALGTRDILQPHGVQVLATSLLILTQEEQDIYNDRWLDINNYITGQKDIKAEWDTYISKLYEMGLQDIIDIYQAALDRFNAG